MPPRDEESRFEQVLARHLRHGANAGCPDAEMLAAYHERALTAEEMNAFKGHIAACGRCQEVLAGLEASEGVTAREKEELYAADLGSAPMGEMLPAAEVVRQRPKRIWKWMAPAAAVAAGILVWVAVRQTPQAPLETTVAVNKQPAAATEAARPSPEPREQASTQSADTRVSATEKQAQSVPQATPPPTSLNGERKEADEVASQVTLDSAQKLDQKASRKDANANATQYDHSRRAENQVSTLMKQQTGGDNAARENQKTPVLPSAQAGMESGKKEAGQVAMENAPADSSEYHAGQFAATEKAKRAMQEEQQKPGRAGKEAVGVTAAATVETKPVGSLNGRKNEKLLRLASPAAGPQVTAALRDREAFFAKNAAGLVVTPEKSVMWRIGAAGMILKTVDGGLSWIQQESGASTELLAGSAPSERICWVVGRGGTILRTTDGEHWERVAAPTKGDLIGIDARDAQTAVIWASQKLPKYVTRNGGKTWQPSRAE